MAQERNTMDTVDEVYREKKETGAGPRQNAERVQEYQLRQKAVARLKEEPTEENLWQCIVAFQSYPFFTASGLPFTYELKRGRRGEFTKELFVDRMANSKSLTWSSVRIAFERAMEQGSIVERPKALGDIRGISYVYSLLWRFGMIAVPEKIAEKMGGEGR